MSIRASSRSLYGAVRRLAWAVALVIGVMSASSASAQLAPGYSGISDAPRRGTQDEYWSVLREIGRCIARTKTEGGMAFLASPVGSPEETRAFRSLFSGHSNVCMQNTVHLTAPRAHIRGAVAEGLFRAQYADAAPRQVAVADMDDQELAPIRDLHDFARCYVNRDYASARLLVVDTQLGTRGEQDRMRRMAQDFGPCLPEGLTMQINPPEVRMALAEALYVAARGGAGQMARGSR